jgi:hypothetical protein
MTAFATRERLHDRRPHWLYRFDKSSAEKLAPLGSQFDHHPVMPQLRASEIHHRVDPCDVPAGEGRTASGCC